jgi:hypothetical protein
LRKAKEFPDATPRLARHGDKMIKLEIHLWTNGLAEKGSVIPKHCWDSGMLGIQRNEAHGIVPGKTIAFNSMLDLGRAIQQMLIRHKIVLHPNRQARKYTATQRAK